MTGVVTNDIRTQSVEERAAIAVMDVRLRQVTQGAFQGRTQTAAFDNVKVYRDTWSQLTRCHGTLVGNYIIFGASAATSATQNRVDWCGFDTGDNRIAIGLPGKEFDYIIPADTQYAAMLLSISCLKSTFGDGEVDNFLKSGVKQKQVESAQGRQLLNRIDRVISASLDNPESFTRQYPAKDVEADFLDDLAELGIFTVDQAPVRQATLRDILRRACNAAELLRERITVPQFAAQIDVGQRNLELAFKRYLGITPRRYLNHCRMQQVYRDLRSCSDLSHSVTEVAVGWGFNELGRFSGEYRNLFGELPSVTLKRPPLATSNRLFDL